MTPEDAALLEALIATLDRAEGAAIFAAAIFTRVSAVLFFLPGYSERYIPLRVKIGAALAFAVISWPLIAEHAPGGPDFIDRAATLEPLEIAYVIAAEAVVGLVVGLAVRLLIFALQTAGSLAAQSLSISQMFGAGVAPDPEPTIATILTLGGVALALNLGLHVKAVLLIADSYAVAPFGVFPLGEDVALWTTERFASAFSLAVSLALPFLIVSFAYNLALGFINKAMPQMMVAFVGMPAITGAGLLLLTLTVAGALTLWTRHLDAILAAPLGVAP